MRVMQLLLPGGGKLTQRFVDAALATASKSWRGDKEEFQYVLNGGQDDAGRRAMEDGGGNESGSGVGSDSGGGSGTEVVEAVAAGLAQTLPDLAEGEKLTAAGGGGLGDAEDGDENRWYSRPVFTSGPGDAFGKQTQCCNRVPLATHQSTDRPIDRRTTPTQNLCRALKTVRWGAAHTRDAAWYGTCRG